MSRAFFGRVAKLADAPALGAGSARNRGSNPLPSTTRHYSPVLIDYSLYPPLPKWPVPLSGMAVLEGGPMGGVLMGVPIKI